MGFLVSEFQGLDYVQYKDMYVSIQSFTINRVNNKWMCRYFLQAHRSREEKLYGFSGFFLSYYVQTAEIEIHNLETIVNEIYANAKTLFGEDKCTDVLEDSLVAHTTVQAPADVTETQAPVDVTETQAPVDVTATPENGTNDGATA
jgi:hypothetical protein